MKRRDRIKAALQEWFKSRTAGAETIDLDDLVDTVMEADAPVGRIVHVLGPNAAHRLWVGDKCSDVCPQQDIARCGNVIATTDARMGELPQVAVLRELDDQYRTVAVQTMEALEKNPLAEDDG